MRKIELTISLLAILGTTTAHADTVEIIKQLNEIKTNWVLDQMAEADTPVGRHIAEQQKKKRNITAPQERRSQTRSMKYCIKPNNVIDEDVKECMEGLRERTW